MLQCTKLHDIVAAHNTFLLEANMNVEDWSEELTKNWKQAQQQFWKNISSQYAAAGASPETDFPNVTEALNGWWSLMNPSMSNQADATMKQATDMGKAFTQFAESFSKVGGDGTQSVESWLNAMEQGFKYRQSMNSYLSTLSAQGLESAAALRERMAGMEQAGESIKSLRELYELWIDINEEVYSKFSMSQKGQDIYGDLVNACVAFQGGMDSAVESQLKAFNVPTKQAQDDLLKELAQEKRENEVLRKRIKELEENAQPQTAPTAKTKATKTPPLKPKTEKVVKAAPENNKAPTKPGSTAASKPAAVKSDDLTKIKGIGPKFQKSLIALGIQSFSKLATLSKQQAQELDEKLELNGRALRDDWMGQAAQLSAKE